MIFWKNTVYLKMKPTTTFCKYAFDHDPGETCGNCGLEVDQYGNTEEDFQNCAFPDCGCDGERLCMAGEANENAVKYNVEGMYERKDLKAVKAKVGLLRLRKEIEVEKGKG